MKFGGDHRSLIGRTITEIRSMTEDEMESFGWDRPSLVIEIDNAIELIAMQDEEGNGPGTLIGLFGDDEWYVGAAT